MRPEKLLLLVKQFQPASRLRLPSAMCLKRSLLSLMSTRQWSYSSRT
jgi:hypothetical protein